MGEHELDVRPLPKPAKHPEIFPAHDGLAVGKSFVLVNDHDPRIRISKLAARPLPRVLADAATLHQRRQALTLTTRRSG